MHVFVRSLGFTRRFFTGKVQEIEVAVRSAAQHQPAMLDIKHRVPFEEAAVQEKGQVEWLNL